MQKQISLLVLFISITATLCAQTNGSDKAFEVPKNIIINRRFYIDLPNKNQLKIEVSDISDLQRIANMDSLLRIFLQDINQLDDSIASDLTSKRIDYVTDAQNRKKIRFQQFQPKGASFLLQKGDLASLRIEQDTVNMIGIIANPSKPQQKISLTNPRYYHLTFYLNNIHEISNYTNGLLNEKVAFIQQHLNDKWPLILGGGSHYLKGHRDIWGDQPKGFAAGAINDFLNGYITVNVQNYKQYFVPSFSVGAKFVFANREHTYKWEPALLWEPHFLFAKDDAGKLQTYRNDFLTLIYGQGGTTDYDARKDFSFSTIFSLGYLIRRQGNLMEKNTFRLSAGRINFSKITIEPSMYFHDFFRGVTPGVRVSLSF